MRIKFCLCTTLFRAALDNLSSDSWFGKHRQFISSSRLRSFFTEVLSAHCTVRAMAEDAGQNTRAAMRASRTRRSSCGASDFVEEDVAVALEDDDNEIFGTETLSITPNGAQKSTAKRPCVSKDWGEAEEEEETAGPANKSGAASDGKTEIQMPATLQ